MYHHGYFVEFYEAEYEEEHPCTLILPLSGRLPTDFVLGEKCEATDKVILFYFIYF
mgnify:FL=1